MRAATFLHLCLAHLLIVSIIGGCAPEQATTRPAFKSLQQQFDEQRATQLKLYPPPVVAMWDNGDLRRGQQPQLLFGLWADGQIARRLEGRLFVGKITPDGVHDLIKRLGASGLRTLPIHAWVLYPNDPSQLLWIDLGLDRIAMVLDTNATSQDLWNISAGQEPSRGDVEEFLRVWNQSLDVIREVWPQRMDQALFITGLEYPDLNNLTTPPINMPATRPADAAETAEPAAPTTSESDQPAISNE